MAELIWSEPALQDLDQIADYIALDNPAAAKELVNRIFKHVEQLLVQPESGSLPPELKPSKTYRQIVEPPCRIIYRRRKQTILIVHVFRGEKLLKKKNLRRPAK